MNHHLRCQLRHPLRHPLRHRLRHRLRHSLRPASLLPTLLLTGLALWVLPPLWQWGLAQAVFSGDSSLCQGAQGACWAVVGEKYRLILFGRYPYAEQWRPLTATLLLLGGLGLALMPGLPRASLRMGGAAFTFLLFLLLLAGGMAGLTPVDSSLWGGLPLSLLITLAGLLGALPLALGLALGRTSGQPLLALLCRAYVEVLRGLPLVTVLFMAAFVLPLFAGDSQGGGSPLLRILGAIVLFAAAPLAEIIRGGLQGVPGTQAEAARALGLSGFQTLRWVVWPLALRGILPSLVNSAISLFKDSALVTVVGLHELTGALNLALGGDPAWRPYYLEGYLFVGALYWVFCFALSRAGRRLERQSGAGAPGR